MRKIVFAVLLMLFSMYGIAQMIEPVKWTIEMVPLKGGNHYEIVAKAKIDPGFKMYGLYLIEGGPVATSFNFETTENCKQFGKPEERTPAKKSHDKIFDMEVQYYKDNAEIKHKIWVSKKPAKISGYIQYMCCNDKVCTPPTDEEFSFTIKE